LIRRNCRRRRAQSAGGCQHAAASEFPFRDETHCEQLAAQDSPHPGLIVYGRGWRKVWGQPGCRNLDDELSLTVDADVFTQVNQRATGKY
jgi:hypothetical protein